MCANFQRQARKKDVRKAQISKVNFLNIIHNRSFLGRIKRLLAKNTLLSFITTEIVDTFLGTHRDHMCQTQTKNH